ncbi:hypothetical protein PG999_001853 [Apiospora kogelbergensis]|uniref:Rhodopsin domain-containing protein n=1 Tax=Apiospora kogelbergensis TaxID=1337665 RepID=A0AAW0R6N3_9PEZI
MLVALILLLVATTLSQLFAQSIYSLDKVSNGATPTPSNLEETSVDLRIFTALTVLSYVGIWLVKLNFLLFFRRLGNHVPKYRITWWFVLAFNLAAGATAIGLVNYKYTISPTDLVFATYTSIETVRATYIGFTVSCILDAMGDALTTDNAFGVLAFPIWILWGTKVTLQRKLALSGLFGLVIFTIAVSITRGGIFGGVYESVSHDHINQLNITWILFWFGVEYIVVSFRSLFTQREKNARDADDRSLREVAQNAVSKGRLGLRGRARLLHQDLLTTFNAWEDTNRVDSNVTFLDNDPPSGRLSVDFQQGDTWK